MSALDDRRCVEYGLYGLIPLSSWDILTCCNYCGIEDKNGCNGGKIDQTIDQFVSAGFVSGSDYRDQSWCKPYPLAPGNKSASVVSTTCSTDCQKSYPIRYYDDRIKSNASSQQKSVFIVRDNDRVMYELISKGPVIAALQVHADFYTYKGGIYQHSSSDDWHWQVVKITGWGVENGTKFWRAMNTWGPNWGEDGFFRILRDADEAFIESNVYTGYV